MAYMNQERKAARAPKIKEICKRYKVKATLSVRNHSTLVLTVTQGEIDFIGNYNKVAGQRFRHDPMGFRAAEGSMDINPYWYHEHFDGKALKFFKEIMPAMYGDDYFDESDAQTDYFHCSHYIDVNIGRWNKPYALVK